ncbi:MAG: threonine synthase [Lachnospiraceae bacterium]|nr:threonine synthase [Lachnospiraceae bacterium]
MDLRYRSTRNNSKILTASQAIIQGLSEDGGLFVPDVFPKLEVSPADLAKMDYKEVAYEVMKLFFTDFTEDELKYCIDHAYDSKFDTEEIAPLSYVDDTYYMELFHGKTIAFKDMALSILPYLMTTSAKKNDVKEKIIILTATSGDTGKAALAGFADVEGCGIVVFYPKGGVSRIQELQMVTQKGKNVKVVGINGNFDDAQTGVKKIFSDDEFKAELAKMGYRFSSANSINIGRLIPQVAYYVFAYSRLVKEGKIAAGEKINFTVPTGNFGNILAGYYAKKIGLPVHKLICASNENKVLFDFFETGVYDRNREFILTTSPSMDILISSNLERLIYEITGENAGECKKLMNALTSEGKYEITSDMKAKCKDFVGGYATEEEVLERIHEIYERTGYVLDTHTAVASFVYKMYAKQSGDDTTNVVVSTASPYKFTRSVMEALEGHIETEDDFVLIDRLSEMSKIPIPNAVEEIRNAEILHDTVCEKDGMKEEVRKFLEKL